MGFGCNCGQKKYIWGLEQDHVAGVSMGVSTGHTMVMGKRQLLNRVY